MKKILTIIVGIMGILLMMAGVMSKTKKAYSVSIIGGADGPTSVFLAGKVGSDISLGLMAAGVILIVIVTVVLLKKRK